MRRTRLGAGIHVEIFRLGVMTFVDCRRTATWLRTRGTLPRREALSLVNILRVLHPGDDLRGRQDPNVAQILRIFEKFLGSVHVIASRAPGEKRGVHVHSEGGPVCVVVIMEVSNQDLVPGCRVPKGITRIHHRSTS